MRIYIAGSLFSIAEREYNQKIADVLQKEIPNSEISLPQNFLWNSSDTRERFLQELFIQCIISIKNSDVIIAILEGPDVDSGTCVELGYAYANGKPIIGIRTDFRELEDRGVNLMVSKVCSTYIHHPEKNIEFNLFVKEMINSIKEIQIKNDIT